MHNIPFATNLATAELMIKALEEEILIGVKCINK